MADHSIISLRVSTDLKKRLQAAARRNGQSVSAFIKERLAPHLAKEDTTPDPPTEAERRTLQRLIGGIRHGGLTKDIDKFLYGNRR